jgi:hypothetical protein
MQIGSSIRETDNIEHTYTLYQIISSLSRGSTRPIPSINDAPGSNLTGSKEQNGDAASPSKLTSEETSPVY